MYERKSIKVSDLQVGTWYQFCGDLQPCGHDEVVRKVVSKTDKVIVCECGRRLLINKNLHIYEWP